jgi:hypothetical protein
MSKDLKSKILLPPPKKTSPMVFIFMTWGCLKIPMYSYPENDKDLTEKNIQYYP